MVARDVGRENGVTAKGHRVSFRGDGNVLELALIIAELCEYIKYHRTVHFKRISLWYVDYILIKKTVSELSHYNSIYIRHAGYHAVLLEKPKM